MTPPRLFQYGQNAVYIDLQLGDASDRALRTQASAQALRNRFPDADVIVGGGVLVIVGKTSVIDVAAVLQEAAHQQPNVFSAQHHRLPIVFDGPDLQEVANHVGLGANEIVESLTNTDFIVELIGFLPGFGYLGPLDSRLVLPRRKTPRPRVPAGSLGIAGGFAGIYPFASPGGWHLVGRSVGPALFDPQREEAFLFAPGDHVRFESIAANEIPVIEKSAEKVTIPQEPAFVVETAPACATIQDAGRIGQLHRGLPPSGPLDPDIFRIANLAVGNDAGEAALEIPLGRFVFRAKGMLTISVDGDEPIQLQDGERYEIPENSRAVRYVAFRGGVDVPLALGSRATLLVARLGGFSGRPLRKGDSIGIGDRAINAISLQQTLVEDMAGITKIVIDPGPHQDRFSAEALDTLLYSTYSISTLGDRVGVRIDGPKIPRTGGDSALPVPMLRGAMQITTDGTPIIFGPDHPATGGYPVLATVRPSSWGVLARQRAGKPIRFVLGS